MDSDDSSLFCVCVSLFARARARDSFTPRQIVDPDDSSLFVCAREGRDCFTYSGSYGASVDVCL
jgi:hypothetical protein